ncbi:MAG: BNR repeat-containing glycosyl hydrolase, partial [bacterium]
RGVAADFMPKELQETAETGHDPHCMRLHPQKPDRIYQQNHCGIYRIDRPGDRWERIGNAMPKKVGDIGFPIVLHPRDPDTVWVFPMDGGSVWPRVSPGGKPAAFRSKNAGKSWTMQNKGMPASQGWFTVKRQAFCSDTNDPLGLYFGTTSGEIWASTNEGDAWSCIVRSLPHVYSVTTAVAKA